MKSEILVVTHSPSPYQVELFDAVARIGDIELTVVYLHSADPARSWSRKPISHSHIPLDAGNVAAAQALELAARANLVVINYYQHPWARRLMRERVDSHKPWCFWGERPGFRYPLLGRYGRLWMLRALHRSRAPIWGIGDFAIAGYRQEFGANRSYVNLPYFSDLQRFCEGNRAKGQPDSTRVVLYSGALIPRKGVDLLARAFAVVAPRFPQLRLHLMGSGELESELRAILAPVAEQVSFIGFKDWNDLPAVYADADVLCVPSRHDGWALVVPEGLASGLPVIATRRMGAAIDLLKDGENGWLIEADDEGGIADSLTKAASLGDEALARMSNAARQSVATHTLEHGAERFLAACRQAIQGWSK